MSINILTNKLPQAVLINGAEVEVKTNFRSCINIILAFEDVNLTQEEKIYVLLKNLYGYIPENNIEEYVKKGIEFLNCGEEIVEKENHKRLYSFSQDSKYIYVAMKQSMNVDFDNLHWWDFVNYFMALDEKSFFSRILYLRQQKNKGKLTKEEKKYWNDNRNILELKQEENYNFDEKESIEEFKKLLKGG